MQRTAVMILALLAAGGAQAEDARLPESRRMAVQFQKALGAQLMDAIAAGGPVQAISVCSEQAPQIAARFSAQSGARVGRTALRLRNPGNAPDARQRELLARFERELATGVEQPPEHFETSPDGSARYMKAIVVQSKCLACHGRTLAPEVSTAVARHYPADQATGFSAGDLRGAFYVDWPRSGEATQ